MDDLLHIYGQKAWHGDVAIIGDRKALEYLRNAVNTALEKGQGRSAPRTADGEGYYIYVVNLEPEKFDKLILPYTDEMARDNREDAIKPIQFIKPPF